MPKKLLTGTLDEQCAFLYDLAQEKMAQGNYTGAIHALKEIIKFAPQHSDAALLLKQAKARKREQSLLLWCSFGAAALFVGIGTLVNVPNDLWFLLLALVGAALGFMIANLFVTAQRRA